MNQMINQLEFRWTPEGGDGYSVVAASDWHDVRSLWEPRLKLLARPPAIQLPVTVVYQTFGQEAAIMFRCLLQPPGLAALDREPRPAGPGAQIRDPAGGGSRYGDGSWQPGRDALIARAVVGPLELLTPGIALGCGALGVPPFLRPPLGELPELADLPPLEFAELRALAAAERLREQLDQSALNNPALVELVAAVLAWPDSPVVLQVPYQQIGTNDTAALLWGLWRLTYPVLGRDRDWTFSTGEQPLGNTSSKELPHLVVRGLPLPGDPRPVDQRPNEIVIQPESPHRVSWGTESVAELLVSAYRQLPAEELIEGLINAQGRGGSRQDRLTDIYGWLRSVLTDPGQDRSIPDQRAAAAALGPADMRPAGAHSAARSADGYGRLLQRLAAHDPEAPRDLLGLKERPERPDHHERIALRRQSVRRGWFVGAFVRQCPRHVETCIRALFSLIVEPDLDDLAYRGDLIQELTTLMRADSTPAVVLMALEGLIWDRADHDLERDLVSQVGWRWLADHGRYGHLRNPADLATSQQAVKTAPWWLLFKGPNVRISASLANIGLAVIIVETIAIALFWLRP